MEQDIFLFMFHTHICSKMSWYSGIDVDFPKSEVVTFLLGIWA